jgi:hypothetical protein
MKMKVLVSAYACEPEKGSEQAVGWNSVGQAGRERVRQHLNWEKKGRDLASLFDSLTNHSSSSGVEVSAGRTSNLGVLK